MTNWNDRLKFGLGVLRLSSEAFWHMPTHEFNLAFIGYSEEKQRANQTKEGELKRLYEMVRFGVFINKYINPKLPPQDVRKFHQFSWENTPEQDEENEIRNRAQQMATLGSDDFEDL